MRRSVWAGVVAGMLCAGGLWGGEPLRFSNGQKKFEAPKPNPLEQYLNRPFESLKPESSLGPVISPAMLVPFQRPDTPEKDDKERRGWENSWIFDQPKNAARQQTTEEIFKVRQMGPDGRPQQKPSLMEEYFKQREKDQQPGRASTGSTSTWEQNDNRTGRDPLVMSLDRNLDLKDRDKDRNERSAQATSERGAWRGASQLDAQRDGLTLGDLFKTMREEIKKEKDRDERNAEFRNMLDNRNFFGAPGAGSDPLTLGEASRDQISQPTAMRELELMNRAPKRDLLSGQGDSVLGRPGGSVLDNPGLRAPTISTPLPAVAPPMDLNKLRERPAVLPIPKREF